MSPNYSYTPTALYSAQTGCFSKSWRRTPRFRPRPGARRSVPFLGPRLALRAPLWLPERQFPVCPGRITTAEFRGASRDASGCVAGRGAGGSSGWRGDRVRVHACPFEFRPHRPQTRRHTGNRSALRVSTQSPESEHPQDGNGSGVETGAFRFPAANQDGARRSSASQVT
jgi:hypothetical protein